MTISTLFPNEGSSFFSFLAFDPHPFFANCREKSPTAAEAIFLVPRKKDGTLMVEKDPLESHPSCVHKHLSV